MGGNPLASFYVSFQANAYSGGFKGKDAALVGPSGSKGTHGYFPTSPLMRSSFMIMGKGIAKGRNLGDIDMRAIAPTLAKALKVNLPAAELPPLPYSADLSFTPQVQLFRNIKLDHESISTPR